MTAGSLTATKRDGQGQHDTRSARSRAAAWLRGNRSGLFFLALLVGVGSGLGAVAFRYLINSVTWLATGHTVFGQQGRVPSDHMSWLGIGFFALIPAIGGLIYGPLIYRFAREARGHGVPEVMISVAENGGRIRPQVSGVKALASALTIGTGGSVGREGPIVQIGSALASSIGQWVRMPENRLRVLVACGAAGGISATFNAPITGVFFAVELILREVSTEAIFTVLLSSMVADVVSRAFVGSAPFFTQLPHGIALHHTYNYLLVALLAVCAALLGLLFKKALYTIEDLCDRLWGSRPEWARPAVGGLVLGALLLAVPQLYGVGYPVMYHAIGGNYAIWFLLVLAGGKMLAAGLTIGIGGSGGVFAPSLFIGATSGMAFGEIAHQLAGPAVGQPALYALVGMSAVFASAARGPLTSMASVVEMTGNFGLTLPIMLGVAVSTLISRAVSYGTIYTTKLLRRGTDIERPSPRHAFDDLAVSDAMRPIPTTPGTAEQDSTEQNDAEQGTAARNRAAWDSEENAETSKTSANTQPKTLTDHTRLFGPVTRTREPQALFANESLAQALRQLALYGRDGLPVVSTDGEKLCGWVTNQHVLRTVSTQLAAAKPATDAGQRAAAWADPPAAEATHDAHSQLCDYQIVEHTLAPHSPAAGHTLSEFAWSPARLPVSILHNRRLTDADPHLPLRVGDRVNVLVTNNDEAEGDTEASDATEGGDETLDVDANAATPGAR